MNTHNVAGVDGFRQGWIAAVWAGPGNIPSAVCLAFLDQAENRLPPETTVVAVDIPLGLLEAARAGGRACDQQARKLLGPRASSVFSPPTKIALSATTHAEACRLNRQSSPEAKGVSKQSFNIFPKLIDAERSIEQSDWLRSRVIEVHPEVCFTQIVGSPLATKKKLGPGKNERRNLLRNIGFQDLEEFEFAARRLGAGTDDALDACAAAWTAWRYANGSAQSLPTEATGLNHSMRIWY